MRSLHRALRTSATAILGLMLVLAEPEIAHAAEIKVFTTRAIATVLHAVGRDFEHATGHELNVTSDIAIRMVRRIQAGEPFDFLVAAPGQIDELIRDGRILAERCSTPDPSPISRRARAEFICPV
jgi:ABC-type molybdate transport system substrate-binding protein